MAYTQHTNYECTKQTFHPCLRYPVRWLDVAQDFELARAHWSLPLPLEPATPTGACHSHWSLPLTRDDWRQFQEDGYRYAAIIEEGRIVSLAAAWRYSENAWEVAAVSTAPEKRRQNYA